MRHRTARTTDAPSYQRTHRTFHKSDRTVTTADQWHYPTSVVID
ncbi:MULTISPECIES: hypothetical protein [unclassified Nostoc]|nr:MULTISPECIES: hypothetical protein [unclassified Nostoc]